MKKNNMTMDEIRKQHMDVGQELTDTRNKYKKAKENERIAMNLKETIEDASLPEDYRDSLRSKFSETMSEFTEAKNELKSDLEKLNKKTEELKEISEQNAQDIAGVKGNIDKVGTKDDDRNIILKLRQKLMEKSDASFEDWKHQEQDFEKMSKETSDMKDNL